MEAFDWTMVSSFAIRGFAFVCLSFVFQRSIVHVRLCVFVLGLVVVWWVAVVFFWHGDGFRVPQFDWYCFVVLYLGLFYVFAGSFCRACCLRFFAFMFVGLVLRHGCMSTCLAQLEIGHLIGNYCLRSVDASGRGRRGVGLKPPQRYLFVELRFGFKPIYTSVSHGCVRVCRTSYCVTFLFCFAFAVFRNAIVFVCVGVCVFGVHEIWLFPSSMRLCHVFARCVRDLLFVCLRAFLELYVVWQFCCILNCNHFQFYIKHAFGIR